MTEQQAWLDQVVEEAVEPELPIIDPHHHFWDRPGNRYLLDDLLADIRGHNVRQSVFVECSWAYRTDGPKELQAVGETARLIGIATANVVTVVDPSLIVLFQRTDPYVLRTAVKSYFGHQTWSTRWAGVSKE